MKKGVFCLFIVGWLVGGFHSLTAQVDTKLENDKIEHFLESSRNTTFSDSLRNDYLIKAKNRISQIKNDSLKTKFLVSLAYNNQKLGNWEIFRSICYQILENSTQNSDTLNIAKAQTYLAYYFQRKFSNDSAFYYYYKAFVTNNLLGDDLNAGKRLLDMATIQERSKDYTGSEINSIKSIEKLKHSNQYKALYLAHNNLGVVYNELGRFNHAIENFEKSINYLNKIEDRSFFRGTTFNNLGQIYNKQNKFSEAINYFKEALDIKGMLKVRPKTYAMILDNLAYSKFKLGELDEIPELFYQSLKIRDSLQIKDGQVISNHHLVEYYLSKSDTVTALTHARISKNIAKESKYNEGLLQSYLLLSELETDKKGKEYLGEYIKLSDSLQQQEREIREKFTKIAYGTQEVTEERDEVIESRYLIILGSLFGAGFSMLLFFNMRQRSKNKDLVSKQQQDEANVEIYNLMLSQQKMFNKGSVEEKNRISKELHDGVLGRLFGARMCLDALNEGNTEDEVLGREKNIEDLQSIEIEIRKISHNLQSSLFDSDTSFNQLIDQLVSKQSKIIKFEYDLSFSQQINWENISDAIKIDCYRILQVALQNINLHSEAKTVKISFIEENANLFFSIEDDGIGFNMKTKKKGIGLKNIKLRVKDLKGKVDIKSEPNQGTKIDIKIPV